MDDDDKITAFLNSSVKRIGTLIANSFMRKLVRMFGGTGGRVSITRSISVDETSMELVVTDIIETRVFGPSEAAPAGKKHFNA